MKNQWPIWMFVIAVVVIVLFAFNYQGSNNVVPLTDIFPDDQAAEDENIEYIFVDEPAKTASAPAATETVKKEADLARQAPVQTTTPAAQAPVAAVSKQQTAEPVSTTAAAAELTDFGQVPYTIQVSSFKDRQRPEEALRKVVSSGLPGYIASADLGSKGTWYRIYVGRFATKSQAGEYLSQVQKNYSDSFIVSPK